MGKRNHQWISGSNMYSNTLSHYFFGVSTTNFGWLKAFLNNGINHLSTGAGFRNHPTQNLFMYCQRTSCMFYHSLYAFTLHICYRRLYAESVPTHNAYLHTCMILYTIWSTCLDAVCTCYIYNIYVYYLNISTCEHQRKQYLCVAVVYTLLHHYLYTPYILHIRPIHVS